MSERFGAVLKASSRHGDDAGGGGLSEEMSFLVAPVASNARDSWQSYAYYFCGTIGYAFYLALVMSVLIDSRPLASERFFGTISSFFFVMVFIACFACSLFLFWVFSDVFSNRVGSHALAIISLMVTLPLFAEMTALGFSWLVCMWALAGLGAAALFLLAAPFLSSLSHKKLIFFLSVSFILGVSVAIALLYFPDIVRAIALCSMVFAAVLLHLISHRIASPHVEVVLAAESKTRNRSSAKSAAAAAGNSICIGFVLYCSSFAMSSEWQIAAIGFAAVCVAAVMAVDICGKGVLSSESLQLKLFLPCVVIGFLPIPFLGEAGLFAGCALLSMSFAIQFITNMGAVAENVYLFNLSPVRYFASARIPNILGLLFGYAFGFAAFGPFGESGFAPISALFIMVAILVVLATFFYQNRYPAVEEEEKQTAQNGQGRWMRKCDVLAREGGLTQREHQILRFLAKGHDNEFIQTKLYVSQSTVKSHIYSIYRKLGIHSRKELMVLIEEVELSDE